MTDLFEAAKSILQPVATLIAAMTAAGITYYFSRAQARTARRQADIAHDRLRYDLFEKRYQIYREAQVLIRKVVTEREHVDFSREEVNDIIIRLRTLDEAPFFFPNHICGIFSLIDEDIQLAVTETGKLPLYENDDNQRARCGEIISAAERRLRDRLRSMPTDFAAEMSFPQLTRRESDSQ